MWRVIGIIALLAYRLEARVYEKCELARELRDRHSIPHDQIGAFVCIADRQSNFNTAAVGNGVYHGMFQIGSEYWCDDYYAGKGCSVRCSSLTDGDISDDIRCVQTIFDEHQRIFGNGFSAWPSAQDCLSQGNIFVEECFSEDNQIYEVNEVYQPAVRYDSPRSGSVGEGKVYERCELARELLYQHKLPRDQIATWVCIAKHESAFNTSAIGRLNWDGSEDHGLFQISDIYWCGADGKSCDAQCSDFRDNDISDDIRCIKKIHKEHTRLSGDGFNAWTVYPRCKGTSQAFVDGCFESEIDNEIMAYTPRPGVQQPHKPYVQTTKQRKPYEKNLQQGKVYERCELAQELRYKYKIAMEQVATWVCIAQHESAFNTSAIGRLNWDGSEDHGLFQISDIYWCGDDGKSCGATCDKFEDGDISDDVECMLKIFEEHTLLSGDGFNAWTVYKPHCQGRSDGYIDGCFNDDKNDRRPAVTQPYRTTQWTTPRTTTKVVTQPPTTQPSTTRTTTTTRKTTKYVTQPPTTRKTTTLATQPSTTRTTTQRTTTKLQVTQKSTQGTSSYRLAITQPPVTYRTTREPSTFKVATNEPITTTFRLADTTIIETTIKPAKAPVAWQTRKSFESSSTAKPFSVFDLYFNSIAKSSSKNEIKPAGKDESLKKTTQKQTTTTRKITSSRQPTTVRQPGTTRSYITVPKTPVTAKPLPAVKLTTARQAGTTKNYQFSTSKPSITQKSVSTTRIPATTTKKSFTQATAIKRDSPTRQTTVGIPSSKSINLNRPSASAGKTSPPRSDEKQKTPTTIRTTQSATQKTIVKQSNVRDDPQTKPNAVTAKPFNVFSFYLNDYTSKAPISYKPVQFSDRSTVIIKKVENFDKKSTPSSSAATLASLRANPPTTKLPSVITAAPTSPTLNPLSIYSAFGNNFISNNRIGRVVPNVTPHSFEYLLKLTTPRTAFKRQ